jgi:hypothetical protein
VYSLGGLRVQQRLGVSVYYHKLNALHLGFNHSVQCGPATATASNNFDAG